MIDKETKGVEHEIWQDLNGLTGLFSRENPETDPQKLFETEAKIIHTFYAKSYFEAMNMYYKYMDWGDYESDFDSDKLPYK